MKMIDSKYFVTMADKLVITTRGNGYSSLKKETVKNRRLLYIDNAVVDLTYPIFVDLEWIEEVVDSLLSDNDNDWLRVGNVC